MEGASNMNVMEIINVLRDKKTIALMVKNLGILGLSKKEILFLLKGIFISILNDEFFNMKIKDKNELVNMLISEDNLQNIIEFLLNKKCNIKLIKEILIENPQILLYGDNLNNIFVIYKNQYYKGYVLVNDNDYRSYLQYDMSEFFKNDNPIIEAINLSDLMSYSRFNDQYVMKNIIQTLYRDDIKKKYNISENDSLTERLKKSEVNYSRKNYYLKR